MTTPKRIVSAVAILGGLCGWLFLTRSGRHVRERMKKQHLIEDIRRARAIGEKARTTFNDGRKLLSDLKALRESA
jgi:hypothetical protein